MNWLIDNAEWLYEGYETALEKENENNIAYYGNMIDTIQQVYSISKIFPFQIGYPTFYSKLDADGLSLLLSLYNQKIISHLTFQSSTKYQVRIEFSSKKAKEK